MMKLSDHAGQIRLQRLFSIFNLLEYYKYSLFIELKFCQDLWS